MRSNPLLEAALLLILFGLITVPILRITSASPPPIEAPTPTAASVETTFCFATIRAAHPPAVLTILHESETLLSVTNPPPMIEEEWALPTENIGPTGLELEVRATWPPDATPLPVETAIEITLEPDTHSARSATLWTSGPAEDFLPFIWE